MNEFDFRDHKQAGRPPVAIVGAGPIGIEMAVRLTRIGIANEVFDAGSIGHTMSWWAPQTRWFSSNERISIAGVPLQTLDQNKATREEYLRYLRCVVDQFKLNVRTRHKVVGVDGQAGQFRLQIEASGGSHTRFASAIVLAIGGTDRARKLHVPGEQLPHVDGYLRELHGYHGRNVLVVGGRNSAVEAALRLHHVGARVTLCHRGESLPEKSIKYWLMPEMKALLKSGRIQGHFQTQVTRITSHDVTLQHASGQTTTVPVDDVLTLIGYEQDKTLFEACGVQLEGPMRKPVFDEATMQTNVPGIYTAGTATAGTQSSSYKTFLENCHVHVDRIASDLACQATNDRLARPADQRDAIDHSLEQMISMQPES